MVDPTDLVVSSCCWKKTKQLQVKIQGPQDAKKVPRCPPHRDITSLRSLPRCFPSAWAALRSIRASLRAEMSVEEACLLICGRGGAVGGVGQKAPKADRKGHCKVRRRN